MKKIILVLIPLVIFSCSIFNSGPAGRSKYNSNNSLTSQTICSTSEWSTTGHYPCFSCTTANSTGVSTSDGTGCVCINNTFTWGYGMCNGVSSGVPCADGTWSTTGDIPVGGVCGGCDTASMPNSLGTSNTTHTACNCDTVNSYEWNANSGHCESCGGLGATCCSATTACSTGLVCQSGTCATCGASGQVCCESNSCNNGLVCQSGSCTSSCGAAGQVCCASNTCNAGLACQSGTCATASATVIGIHNAIITGFNSVSSGGTDYQYGLNKQTQPTPKTFTNSNLKVLTHDCAAGDTTCSVTIFVDKMVTTPLRPLFVIEGALNPPTASCPTGHLAYVRSIVLLATEGTRPMIGALSSANTPSTISAALGCPQHPSGYVCHHVNVPDLSIDATVQTLSLFAGTNPFDASVVSNKILKIDYSSNQAANLVCLDNLFKPSLWGKSGDQAHKRSYYSAVLPSASSDIAVFTVTLKMQ